MQDRYEASREKRARSSRVGAIVVLAAAAAMMLADTAVAHVVPPPAQTTVEIVDRSEGRVLPIYWHQGRRYVVGKPGNEYAIRVRNTGGGRMLAVMSVDGVNVISGETASPSQSGYVLAPGETADIAGWRKSMSRTAAFYFTALPDSYAARTGRPDNVGVIGVATFRERVRPIALDQLRRKDGVAEPRSEPAPAGAARDAAAGSLGQAPQERLGTGHGRGETSYASYTQFERASETPGETITI